MSQYDFGTIDPYVVDGVALASMLNNWRDALYTTQRGSARPSFIVPGQLWCNDSAGPSSWVVNYYISPTIGDVALFNVNTTTGEITWRSSLLGGPFLPLAGGMVAGPTTFQAQLNVNGPLWVDAPSGQPTGIFRAQTNASGSRIIELVENADGSFSVRALSDDQTVLQGEAKFNRDGSMIVTPPAGTAVAGEVVTASWVRSLLSSPPLLNLQQLTETMAAPAITAGTLAINLALGTVFRVANNANITTFSIANAVPGKALAFTLILTMNGTAYTQAWGANVKWAFGVAPVLTTTNGKKDVLTFVSDDGGSTWQGFVAGQSF